MRLVIEGTSSSGKGTIIKEFPKNYKIIEIDDLYRSNYNCNKDLKNRYYSEKYIENMDKECLLKELGKRMGKNKNVVIDTVNNDPASPKKLNKYLPKDVINVLIYTNLDNLAKNIDARKSYDPRGRFVFNQFAEYYISTNNRNKAVDKINLGQFIKSLLQIKYQFSSRNELENFAKNVFKKMNISDKESYITPRYNKFNLIIDTTNKTPLQLKNEIFTKLK